MTGISLFKIYVTNTYAGARTVDELLLTSSPFLILAFVFYFIQKRRLKFTEINISVDKETFHKAVKLTAVKLGWSIKNISSDSITAIRMGGFSSGSWGELITIVRDQDKILINSICDPDNITSVVSYGQNAKNIRTFKEILLSLPTT